MTFEYQFDEATHLYRVNSRIIPSCTRCLDISGLIDFSFVRQEILMRKSMLGKEAHRACHFFSEGTLDWTSVDPQIERYVVSWAKLFEKTKMRPEKIEYQCVVELEGLLFGMQLDFLGLIFEEEAILELKTSQPHPAHGVQTAGYAIGAPHPELTTPMAKFSRRRRYGAYLQDDGSMAKLKPYSDRRDYKTFVSSLEIASWKMAHGTRVRRLDED